MTGYRRSVGLADFEELIKGVHLKPGNIKPFTTGFSSDEDDAKQAGYERGFKEAQRLFRAELLRRLRGNPKPRKVDVRAAFQEALEQEAQNMRTDF